MKYKTKFQKNEILNLYKFPPSLVKESVLTAISKKEQITKNRYTNKDCMVGYIRCMYGKTIKK